jgi:DNA repair exonuclease SbcCD nuclease subunit
MVHFLHTADVHLGLRITRFEPEKADKIRDARFRALERVLKEAAELEVDFIIIAGDLFDDSSIDATTARRAFLLLKEASCPVFVLPGNHDPLTPGSVWERDPWRAAETEPVNVLRKAEPVRAPGGVTIFPCPVFRKTSLDDPTAWIPIREVAEEAGGIRIGIAHGSVKDRETLPSDDHLIDRNAAELRKLDYLALGHWHSIREYTSEGKVTRIAYSGVPEPIGFPRSLREITGWVPYSGGLDREDFADDGSGNVLSVKIDGPGERPDIKKIRIGVLTWSSESYRANSEKSLSDIIKGIAVRPDTEHTVLKLRVEGVIPASAWARLDELRTVVLG